MFYLKCCAACENLLYQYCVNENGKSLITQNEDFNVAHFGISKSRGEKLTEQKSIKVRSASSYAGSCCGEIDFSSIVLSGKSLGVMPLLNDIAVAAGLGLAVLGLQVLLHQYAPLVDAEPKTTASRPQNGPSQEVLESLGSNDTQDLVNLTLERADSQEVLSLLYLIAEDYAVRTGYVHRGVTCNTCGVSPILGTRYHCTECADVDLCQGCESAQRHDPMHVLVKIKIPIPVMVGPRWVRESWRPRAAVKAKIKFRDRLPEDYVVETASEINLTVQHLEILHERFKYLVDINLPTDSVDSVLPYAISVGTLRWILFPTDPDSLAAVQIAKLYDQDRDGIVLFEDYVRINDIMSSFSSRHLVLAFQAYDIDDRKTIYRSDMKKFLISCFEQMCHSICNVQPDEDLTGRLESGALMSAKPLASLFFSEPRGSSDQYPRKDAKFHTATSISELASGELSNKLKVPEALEKIYGAQATHSLLDSLGLIAAKYVDYTWDALRLKNPTTLAELDKILEKRDWIGRMEPQYLCGWMDIIEC